MIPAIGNFRSHVSQFQKIVFVVLLIEVYFSLAIVYHADVAMYFDENVGGVKSAVDVA